MKKKTIIVFMVLITIINTFMPAVYAVSEITKANLINDHKMDSHIMYYNEGRQEWRDIQCNYICYKLDGEKYPVYCITHGVNGVDEEGSYTVLINDLIRSELIYNTIINGYPYKTPAQLGVETVDDAYVATKHAVNSVLLNRDVNTFYKAADARGEKIINAIYEISEKGKAGNGGYKEATVTINKIGDLVESGEYYYQEYNVSADVNISKYTVKSIENFPVGSYVVDNTGVNKETFLSNEKFRIMIPKIELNKDIYGKVNVIAECKTNPIFYGEAPKANIQDYAITYKPYVSFNGSTTFSKVTNSSSIKIIKQDVDTLKPIKEVEFGLYNINNEYITSGKTNVDGVVIFNNLYQGIYKIKELNGNVNYEKDNTIYEIATEYNKQVSRTITNTHKKGNLKIIKVDRDEKNIVLEGIEFDLIDSNEKTVAHLVTDVNGVAQINNINIGSYTIKETKTKENYNLCTDNNIEVKWNETTEITIQNEKKKGQIQIIKQDKENEEIKLEGVEFHVVDSNNNVVDQIITDLEGKAITKKLPIGKYIIKEISLGTNDKYLLNEEEYIINVEENKISKIVVENEYKKGNLKIIKVDKDENDIVLEGIEFDLIDSNEKTVAHLVTDVNGVAQINNINIGSYTIKETKTKENYNLCTDNNIEVKWNETTEITIQNEKKKGQIQIIKQDKENEEIKLEGVEFHVIDSNNNIVDQIITDLEGEAITKKLPIGKYIIKEISLGTNDKYLLNEEEYIINVEENKISKIVVENEYKKGNLKIIKVDKDENDIVLEGIEFDLIDSNEKTVAHLVTDVNGVAQINNINIGSYTIKETKTKENYNLCTDNNIEVKWNETTEITIQNEKKKGQIQIIKQDKENEEIKLEGVEFHVIDSNNNIVDQIITDLEGEAITKKLPIGEYIIKEISLGKNAEYYILEANEYIVKIEDEKITKISIGNIHKKGNLKITKVDKDDKTITLGAIEFDLIDKHNNVIAHLITDVNGEAYIENINIGEYILKETLTKKEYNLCENKDIIVEWNKISDIVIENEKKKGQIQIIKQDAEKEEIKLEGVKFQILDINNKVVEEIVTDRNGEAISSKLLIGEYKIKEIDLGNNINYLVKDEIYNVKVENEKVTKLIVENEHKKGTLKIKKVDKDNLDIVLEGVEFEIIDKDGFKYIVKTDKEGLAIVDNIRIGNVEIIETKTNKEYILPSEKLMTEIKHNETIEIIIENEKKKGQLEIFKIDKDERNIKIAGVEFEILDVDGKVVDRIVSNENGYGISKRLPEGKYYLKEVKTNSNYVLNQEVIIVNIEVDKLAKIEIENEKIKGKIQIIKMSSNDSPILGIKEGQSLENVEFEIFNSNNELVQTLITDKEGKAISNDLEIGRYKVKEKSTNKYYILNSNEFVVNINKNNEVKVLEIKNEAAVPRLNIGLLGQQFAEKNEELKYEFEIYNISNTKLDNFTWEEHIPYENSKVTKMVTGIYNEDLNYGIYYKTNKNDYRLFKVANSLISEYINFNDLNLSNKEIITEIKVEYKTVSKDFSTIVNPTIYTKIDNNVKKEDKIINNTNLFGNMEDYIVRDSSNFETVIIEKEIIKKLPKTGC